MSAAVKKDTESGSVLVLALLVTMVILAIGLTAMWLSSSSMKMSGNIARRQEALYAAEAGLDYARYVLKNTADWAPLMLGCGGTKDDVQLNNKGRGVVLCANKNTYPLEDVSLVKEPGHKTKIDSPQTNKRAKWMARLQYTVFVRNDEAEMLEKGLAMTDDKDWRVVLRAEGTGRDQLSFFAIEAVVSRASASLDEDEYSQLGGSAQNQNSEEGVVPLTKVKSP